MTAKLKTNRNYCVCERGCPILNTPLFTQKVFIVSKVKVIERVKLWPKSVEEGTSPLIYGIIFVRFIFSCRSLLSVEKTCLFSYLISKRFWINICIDFGSLSMNNQREIGISFFFFFFFFFLAKWLSHSFDQTISIQKRVGRGSLVALQFLVT